MQTDDSRRGRNRERRIWPWVVAAVLLVAAQSATHLTNELFLGGRYPSLNAAVDASVFGRANSLAIGMSAALVALAARHGRRRASRLLLAGFILLVMVDDATGFHDRLGVSLDVDAAVLGLGTVLTVAAWLLLREAAVARRGPRLLLVVGLSALASAVVVRLVAATGVGADLGATTKALGVACEQGLDFGGWVLLAMGLFALLAEESDRTGEESLLVADPRPLNRAV